MRAPQRTFQYREIARELESDILRGAYRRRGKLPSERDLGRRFGVQRGTVRQALALLEEEGHIATQGRRGSFLRAREASARETLLLTLPQGSSPHLTHLMEGVTRAARAAGYRVRRADAHHPEGAALDPVPDVADLPADAAGMVLWPQNPTDEAALIRLNAAFPLVLVDRRVLGVVADVVRFDDVTGGRLVTEHLLAQGHRRIAFVTDDGFAETVQHRWQGYAAAHEGAEVPLDPSLTLFFNGIHEPFFSLVLRHLLETPDRPTAMVCSNDLVAFRLLHFLQSEGLRVPDDLSVTGYGNVMPDYVQAMGLTSVEQPFAELGRTAAGILLERLLHPAPDRPRSPRDVTIPVRLVVRRSSGPP